MPINKKDLDKMERDLDKMERDYGRPISIAEVKKVISNPKSESNTSSKTKKSKPKKK